MFTVFRATIYNEDGMGIYSQRLFSENSLAEDWVIQNKGEGEVEEVRVFENPIPKDEDYKNVLQSRSVSYLAYKKANDKAEESRLIAQAFDKAESFLKELTKEELGALLERLSK